MNIHINEDTAKPENRTNLALFSILMIPEVRHFVLEKLEIPKDMLIFPCPNLQSEEFDQCGRPDFKITRSLSDREYGFIEIELGQEDKNQIVSYAKWGKIYSIVGGISDKKGIQGKGDLCLEEIYSFIKTMKDNYKNTQQEASLELFSSLGKYYVIEGNFNQYNKRSPISEKMAYSFLIQEIIRHFGEDKVCLDGKIRRGHVSLDTIKENGFSLRVYSTETSKGLSLMSRAGGRPYIEFPFLSKLVKYFSHKQDAAAAFASVIKNLGAYEVEGLTEKRRAKLPIEVVERNFLKIARAIEPLI